MKSNGSWKKGAEKGTVPEFWQRNRYLNSSLKKRNVWMPGVMLYLWPGASWTTPGIAGTFHFWGWKKLLQLVKERNLDSDSNVSKHLGFFGNDPRDTRPKIYVSCLHWGKVIFFFSPLFLKQRSWSSMRGMKPKWFFFLSPFTWKWSAVFESETFVERQRSSAGHETKNLRLVPSLVTADQAANTLKEQRLFTSQFFCQHHYLY